MRRRGSSMVAVLSAVAVLLLLVVVFMYGGLGPKGGVTQVGTETIKPRADGQGKTIPGAAMARARDEACRSNLQQVRAAIQMAKESSPDDKAPESLDELHLGSMTKCTIEPHEPYTYDPATGEVHCPHPGHEKF